MEVYEDYLLRLPDVRKLIPYSKPTIYRMISEGKFPRQVKCAESSRAAFWWASDIKKFLESVKAGGLSYV